MVQSRLDDKWFGTQLPFEYQTAQRFEYITIGCHHGFLCTAGDIQMVSLVQTNHSKTEVICEI